MVDYKNSERYTDKDFADLGLDRSFWTLSQGSGDDLKMAQEIQRIGKDKGRNIQIAKNGLGEIYLKENGKRLGGNKVFNPSGLDTQDLVNIGMDPFNLGMLIPGAGLVAKGASLAKKALTLGKLGAAVGATDLATTTGADIQNNQGLKNIGDNATRAATAAALTPVVAVAGEKVARGVGNLVGKKKPFEEGGVALTRGQATDDARDLAYEAAVLKGEHGEAAQRIMQEYRNKQTEALKNKTTEELGASFDNPNRNNLLGEELKEGLANKKASDLETSNKLYVDANINNNASGLSRANTQELLNNLEKNIDKEAVSSFGKYAPDYESNKVLQSLKKGFNVDKKTTNANPNNMSDIFKNQAGNVDVRFNDGSLNNFRYGNYREFKDGTQQGFVGKKIEQKHPDVATLDFKQQLRNARLIKTEQNGRRTYLSNNGIRIVVSKDNQILTAYKPNRVRNPAPEMMHSMQNIESTSRPLSFHQETPLGYSTIPNSARNVNTLNNRLYPVINLAKLEMGRKMLNEAIQKATTNQDKSTLAKLMQVKSVYDKTIKDFAKQGKFEGDTNQVNKLINARQNKAEYHNKWTNTKEENLKSAGANEVLDIINNPNKGGAELNKLLDSTKTTNTKQLQALSKLKQVGGDEEFKKLRELYLNNLLTDISEKGGTGNLRGQSTVDNLRRYEKLLNHLSDNLDKNPAVANKILSQDDLIKLNEIRDITSKIARTEQAKPHRNISTALGRATLGTIGKVPLVGGATTSAVENLVKPAIVRNYLNKKLKENRISKEQAEQIGAKFGVVFGNEQGK